MTATTAKQRGFLERHVPLVSWIGGYRWREWFPADLVAGLSVAALLIPESMGYAGVAGLPPEVGLYAAPLALLGYAVLGRSTVLVVAASSSTAAVSVSVVADIGSGHDAGAVVALSAALALFTGMVFVAAGLARLGWVANFMSKTVIEGFIIGLSMSIIVGQLDNLLGTTASGDNSFAELGDLLSQVGAWDRSTAVVGVLSLGLLFGLERFVEKVPAALTVVVLSVLYVRLASPSGVAIVGDIPQGLPEVGVPDIAAAQVGGLLAGGLAVMLVGFSEGYGAASSFARKYGDRLESNQEFLALGAANLGSGLTSGMVVGGSLSKTAANDAAQARSQISNVVNAALVVLTLLFLAPLFESLPEATLAAIVIHALVHSADPRRLARVWAVTRQEFWLAVVVLMAVLVLDTLPAVILGVVVSLGIVTYRVSFPKVSELGRDPITGALESRDVSPDAEPIGGIVVCRLDAPLIYSNAEAFAGVARDLVDSADPPAQVLVVDCEAMFGIDYTGCETLAGLVEDMHASDVTVRLARVHSPVLERLRRSGLVAKLGPESVFGQVDDAIAAGV